MTAATEEKAAGRPWQLSAEALALWEKFPPRPVPASWPATRRPRGKVAARLLAPPFAAETSADRCNRKLALLKVLDWLELHPGRTWQERWDATGPASTVTATGGAPCSASWPPPGTSGHGQSSSSRSSAWAWPS
jgi:hypothetical protein